jgi:DNA-binding beta-propeller fold protein YncE
LFPIEPGCHNLTMNHPFRAFLIAGMLPTVACLPRLSAQGATEPYKVLNSAKVGGEGGFDYVFADSDGRRLYIPRGNRVDVFDLDTLNPVGQVANANSVHGVAVDPKSHHGFCSSKPIVMWDSQTLAPLKTIDVQGNPDGIFFDPATSRVFVLSHRTPNVTAIDSRDGSIVGTVDLGGAPEQGVSDLMGHVYIDVEDKDNVAVVEAGSLKVTAHYGLGGKGGTPAGLSIDPQNHILFACCRNPQAVVILNAADGTIITSLPIGKGVDSAEFNPGTMEAFSSQGDGTLTVVREVNPSSFVVEQNVPTKTGAKTSTLDLKTNRVFLITAAWAPPTPEPTAVGPSVPGGNGSRGGWTRRGPMIAGSFEILTVGK